MVSITRRAALSAAAMVPAVVPTPHDVLRTAQAPMMALLAERNRLVDWINVQPSWGPDRDGEMALIQRQIASLEQTIQTAPDFRRDTVEAQLAFLQRVFEQQDTVLTDEEVAEVLSRALQYIRGSH